jgi:hypothetical protein
MRLSIGLGLCAALGACGKSPPPTTPSKIQRFDRGTSMAVITDKPCPSDVGELLRANKESGVDVYILRPKGAKSRCKIVKTTRQGSGPHPEVRRFVEEDRDATH